MSESAKRIDTIIRGRLAPRLKQAGFRKNARNFYREHSDHVDLINVQASLYNSATDSRFTVNVGVYYPEISNLVDARPVRGLPKEYDCTIRERIGSLRADQLDYWWRVDSASDDHAIAIDLASQVDDLCLPWLDQMSDLAAVGKAAAARGRPIVAAAIALKHGRQDEAKAIIQQVIANTPRARSRFVSWAREHDLQINE